MKPKSIVKSVFEDTNQYMKDGVLLRQMANELDAIDLGSYDEIHALGDIYETILKDLQSAGHAGEFYTPRAVTDFMAKMIEPKLGEQMAEEMIMSIYGQTKGTELEKMVKTIMQAEANGTMMYYALARLAKEQGYDDSTSRRRRPRPGRFISARSAVSSTKGISTTSRKITSAPSADSLRASLRKPNKVFLK